MSMTASLALTMPELILSIGAMALLMVAAFGGDGLTRAIGWGAVALFAAFFPVGQLANISNSGTLFAFAAVSIAVMVIRKTDPGRHRPFKTPLIYVTAPIAILGCLYLFASLDHKSIILFLIWATIGLAVYFGYSRSRSHVGLGYDDEVHETDSDVPPQPVPPVS